MSGTALKPKKPSLIDFTQKYANNPDACYDFFFNAKYPSGWYCEKCGSVHYRKIVRHNVTECKDCGHQQYLFAGTIFQDNKLDLYKLLLGLFLFFTANKGISGVEMSSALDVNYKTALLLCRKCRIIMAQSNADQVLDSLFYEADTAYIGSESKEPGHTGNATEKQPFMAVLSTGEDNRYPHHLKVFPIPTDNGTMTERFLSKRIVMSLNRTLNTDGKTTFNILSDRINLVSEKIDYDDRKHRLHWLNILIGNIKNHITGIYHGVSKRDLPLFLQEQEYRFNHRYTGNEVLNKIQKHLAQSFPAPKKTIVYVLNLAESYFTPDCV